MCLIGAIRVAGTEITEATQELLKHPGFPEGLIWLGPQAPSQAESSELLEVVTNLDQPWWRTGVEEFLASHPHSPWAASLRYDYASFCRDTGRTTKALDQFNAAWALVKADSSPKGRPLGGAILANWMDLLSSLGRLETLKELSPVGDRYQFVNPQDRNKFEGAKNSYYLMLAHPGIAYRCGTFALKAVGGALQPTNRSLENLVSIPSPANGFSIANLLDIARQSGLNLIAVRRTRGEELIVPSVVHWRQNHYAAILKQQDDLYLVSDPTFGHAKWMPAEVINEEASGEFLIPAQLQTAGWTQLARNETENIHGMGLPNNIKDGDDKSCNRNFDGSTGCTHCPPKGMPIWWVSEPYINLWLADEPISYLTSRGEPFTFQVTYKQRDTRPADPLVPVTGWNNSWASYIQVEDMMPCYGSCTFNLNFSYTTVYLPNGGEVDFAPGQSYDPQTRTQLELEGSGTLQAGNSYGQGLRLIHADGSQDLYEILIREGGMNGGYATLDCLLTRHIDPHGDTTWFEWDPPNSAYVLTFVVDPDGHTNALTYTSNNLLSAVTNAYGQSAHFYYDGNKNLTSIVDAAGMSSSLTYNSSNNPTALITPYGTNKFTLVDNGISYGSGGDGNAGGDANGLIDRSALVVDPTGATNLYIYRYDSALVLTATNFSNVPTNTPFGTLDSGTGSTNSLSAVYFRNSFYWGPKQYALLSTQNMSNFVAGDYLLGRMRHWLQDTNDLYLTDLLSVQRDASPNGGQTEGLKTFYDYQGKAYKYQEGTNDLPSVKAWQLADGETHYDYLLFDYFGNITNWISTYTLPNGTVGTRDQPVYLCK